MNNGKLNKTLRFSKLFDKYYFIISLTLILLFWFLLYARGYPLPCVDDLFFIGQAINLAKGGDFVNPLLESWNQYFHSGKYFYHPPYYSFILAAWLRVFGVGARSFALFQIVNGLAFSTNIVILLTKYKQKKWLFVPIVILYALWMNQAGLRSDSTGMTLLSLGLVCLTIDKLLFYFLGFLFSIASFLSSSLVLSAYAIPFSVGIVVINSHQHPARLLARSTYIKQRISMLILAVFSHVLIFAIMINFRFTDWLTDFLLHASLRRASTLESLPSFLNTISEYWNLVLLVPSYILFVALVIGFLSRFSQRSFPSRVLIIAFIFGILLNILIYVSSINTINFFVALCILCLASSATIGKSKNNVIFLFSLGILLSSQLMNIISLTHRQYPTASYFSEVRAQINRMPQPRKYVIDSAAAKYLFDYNFPKNTISWDFIGVNATPSSSDKKENETWIVSRSNLGIKVPELGFSHPVVNIFNRDFNSIPKDPYELIILP